MSETGLPTGTVTFLLTDVESSTSRWESHPAAMAPAIARHYEILDEAIVVAGGVRPVEQGEGDSVVGAFRRSVDAVAAAVAAQRALSEEAWPAGAELRVRMAIHTGDAQLRDEGNYFGPAIIRCARLRSCASGGQVLVSRTAVELLPETLLPGVSLVNLGRHRLKDLQHPEDVWQVSIDGLINDFSPIASHVVGRDSLPVQASPLIGRVGELDELVDLASDERLVTLTGSGGCGKTRLAVELAGRLTGEFPGGVAWIELAPHGEMEAVVSTMAIVFGVVESPGERLLDRVIDRLRRRDGLLVVFDNAEHLLDSTATIVDALMNVEHVTVIVTSREPLGLSGEVVWRVPSLASPAAETGSDLTAEIANGFESVQLFVDRARRARRGFELTDDNAGAVAHICHRLDGVPLAIELAAARIRTMPPERIASQLDDRFRLLAGGSRTALPRQQTLLASIAWSEGLLDDVDREVFRRLGVFVGGFSAEAAQHVIGSAIDIDHGTIDDAVARLVDKSLVQFDEANDRYVLLETIRSYALDRLIDAGVAAAMRDAHAAWYASWLDDLSAHWEAATSIDEWFHSRSDGIDAIQDERANLNAALEWVEPGSNMSLRLVAGMAEYWLTRSGADDSVRHGMPALRLGDRADPAWLRALVAMGGIRTNEVDFEYDAIKVEGISLAQPTGNEKAMLRLDGLKPMMAMSNQGPSTDLVDQVHSSRQRAMEIGEWYTAWNLMQQTSNMLQLAGRINEAQRLIDGFDLDRTRLIRSSCDQLRGSMARSVEQLRIVHRRIVSGHASDTEWSLLDVRVCSLVLATGWTEVGDELELPRQLTAMDTPAAGRFLYDWSVGLRQLASGDLLAARQTLTPLDDRRFATSRGACWILQIDMALGDHPAAQARVDAIRSRWGHLDAPLVTTIVDLVAAELVWAADAAEAFRLARRALDPAVREGLWPSAIDAIEAIAVLHLEAGRQDDAARLLGVTTTAREEMAYRYRYAHRTEYVTSAMSAVEDTAAYDAGGAMSLHDAVALVNTSPT